MDLLELNKGGAGVGEEWIEDSDNEIRVSHSTSNMLENRGTRTFDESKVSTIISF